jgi:hypothetical protein
MMTMTAFDRHTQIRMMDAKPWPLADALGALGALRWRRDHPGEGKNQASPVAYAREKYHIRSRDIDTLIAEMERIVEDEKDKAHRRYQEVTAL